MVRMKCKEDELFYLWKSIFEILVAVLDNKWWWLRGIVVKCKIIWIGVSYWTIGWMRISTFWVCLSYHIFCWATSFMSEQLFSTFFVGRFKKSHFACRLCLYPDHTFHFACSWCLSSPYWVHERKKSVQLTADVSRMATFNFNLSLSIGFLQFISG
jgi:hypothetical protein